MAEHMPGDPDADGRFVRLDDGDMHVVEDGRPGGPAVLLVHGTAASAARWDPVIPQPAGPRRVPPPGPSDIPAALIQDTLGMTPRALAATGRAGDNYLKQRALPDLLTALGLPVLVIFGADDHRWRSSSAAAYRAVPGARVELLPGVGHPPIQEHPQTTTTLLLAFAATAPPPPCH